jgi:hypothetical protein
VTTAIAAVDVCPSVPGFQDPCRRSLSDDPKDRAADLPSFVPAERIDSPRDIAGTSLAATLEGS